MDNVIQVELRGVYGKILAYPVNEQAHKMAKILGTKTFPRETIKGLQDMGFIVGQVVAEIVL